MKIKAFAFVSLVVPVLLVLGQVPLWAQGGLYNACYSCMKEPLHLASPIYKCCRGSECENFIDQFNYTYVLRDYFVDCRVDPVKKTCVGRACAQDTTTWGGGPITQTEEECNGF